MPTIVKCPICRSDVAFEGNPFRPFCSERCKLTDLGCWVTEKYRIPAETTEQESVEEGQGGDGKRGPANANS